MSSMVIRVEVAIWLQAMTLRVEPNGYLNATYPTEGNSWYTRVNSVEPKGYYATYSAGNVSTG